MYTSKISLTPRESGKMVRPLSRKDIFYSGSVTNLREYQSQKSLTNYRNSVISLTKYEREARERDARDAMSEVEKGERMSFYHFIKLVSKLDQKLFSFFFQNTISVHVWYCRNHLNRPSVQCWILVY